VYLRQPPPPTCPDKVSHTRQLLPRGISPATAQAVLSAFQQTQMRTGPRSPTWLSGGESKTELPSETTVSNTATADLRTITDLVPGKKLKRRLEDLERRAGSSSASPPQVHAELQQQQHRVEKNVQQHYRRSPEILHRQPSPRLLQSHYTPPMEDNLRFSHGFEREGSRTPPLFAYHSYPAPEEIVHPPYPQSQPYRPVSSSEYSDYLAPVPVTLPSMMHFHEVKREVDTMSPFNMSYQGLPAMIIHGHNEYEDSNPHVSRVYHISTLN